MQKRIKHENTFHNKVFSFLINTYGVKEAAVEVKKVKPGVKTFNPSCIRLNQRAMLANECTVYFHPSDIASDIGGSRGLDGFIATSKYLCIVHFLDDKPYVIPVFMNEQSRIILTESTKLADLVAEFGSFVLA